MTNLDVPFPQKSSSPGEIRRFLTWLLETKHDVDRAEAEAIASKWKLGRGRELLEFKPKQFVGTFGADVGSYLHHSLWDDQFERWQQTPSALIYKYAIILGNTLVVLALANARKRFISGNHWVHVLEALVANMLLHIAATLLGPTVDDNEEYLAVMTFSNLMIAVMLGAGLIVEAGPRIHGQKATGEATAQKQETGAADAVLVEKDDKASSPSS